MTGPASVVVSAGGVDSTRVMGDHLSHSSYATVTYGAVASQGAVLVAAYAQLLVAEALHRQPRR